MSVSTLTAAAVHHKRRQLEQAAPGVIDILIVEDELPIAQLIAETLDDEGYRVRVLHDGASALLEITRRPPALVLLDVAMPVMLGSDVLTYLRGNGFEDLPVIMMTASLNAESYAALGATDVLAKPFEVDELLAMVARHFPRGRSART